MPNIVPDFEKEHANLKQGWPLLKKAWPYLGFIALGFVFALMALVHHRADALHQWLGAPIGFWPLGSLWVGGALAALILLSSVYGLGGQVNDAAAKLVKDSWPVLEEKDKALALAEASRAFIEGQSQSAIAVAEAGVRNAKTFLLFIGSLSHGELALLHTLVMDMHLARGEVSSTRVYLGALGEFHALNTRSAKICPTDPASGKIWIDEHYQQFALDWAGGRAKS